MAIVDPQRYSCATHKDRGDTACPSRVRVPRKGVEHALLEGIRNELLNKGAFQRLQQTVAAEPKKAKPDLDGARRRIADAESIHGNIMRPFAPALSQLARRPNCYRQRKKLQ